MYSAYSKCVVFLVCDVTSVGLLTRMLDCGVVSLVIVWSHLWQENSYRVTHGVSRGLIYRGGKVGVSSQPCKQMPHVKKRTACPRRDQNPVQPTFTVLATSANRCVTGPPQNRRKREGGGAYTVLDTVNHTCSCVHGL